VLLLNLKGSSMKFVPLIIIAGLYTTTAFAQPVVTTPGGRVTAGLPVPIAINFAGEGQKQFDVTIASEGVNLIQASKQGEIGIRQISTRFQALSARVEVSVSAPDTEPFQTTNTLDLPAPAVIPEDRADAVAIIGKNTYSFIRSGKDVETKNAPGRFAFFVKNASSRKHYVTEMEVELTKGDRREIVRIKGSPYWYEPLMVIEGNFDSGAVIRVVSD